MKKFRNPIAKDKKLQDMFIRMKYINLCKRYLPLAILVLASVSASCQHTDDFQFGTKYNGTRQKFGSPLIKRNMKVHHCCGVWTSYEIEKVPDNGKAYHCSKTIRAITNGRLTEEKDIYRKNLDDTTILQLNLLTHWIWEDKKIEMKGNVGKIDKRALNLPAKHFIRNEAKYLDYAFKDLDQTQIDSVLVSWGLSRFDNE